MSHPSASAEVGASPVPLDDARLSEIGDLLRYQSSVSFQSARAAESVQAMHTALVAVRRLHFVMYVRYPECDDVDYICAACGENRDGGEPCSTLRALGQTEPDPE